MFGNQETFQEVSFFVVRILGQAMPYDRDRKGKQAIEYLKGVR